MIRLRKMFAENGLLVVFTALFVVCLAGQALAGRSLYNGTQAAHGLAQVGCLRYLATGEFLQGMFSNWQAAVLQLGSLIVFGVFLRQRGAPHSKRLAGSGGPRRLEQRGTKPRSHGNSRSVRPAKWIYRHSLSLVFSALFLGIFMLHLLSGEAAYDAQLALSHQRQLSLGEFLVSAKFWFATLQTWEAEYMAIALYIALSIFLREEGSPESKPTEAANSDTGDPNE
jgi:hypothetical protein